jgi:Fur family transcriptional regulator, ferric uptake regulator
MGELHTTVAAALQEVSQRYTSARRAVVEVLEGSARPVTTAEIVGSRPGLAQSSVYRNLAVLEQAGVVRRVMGSDEYARYELDEALTHHHHHLVCTTCGAIEDFPVGPDLEKAVQRAAEAAGRRVGFAADGHRLDVFGRCQRCR